jgi:probable rRNA maturation factor
MNIIDINYENSPNLNTNSSISKFCDIILRRLDINDWEISILICDDLAIQKLNSQFRFKNEPTDVLSFTQDLIPVDGTIYAGDIVISMETLNKNSISFKVALDEELKRVLIHGILHLKGMDHATNSKEEQMLQFQETILNELSGDHII